MRRLICYLPSGAGMGFTTFSIGLILCTVIVSVRAQGAHNSSTNGTDAGVCTSGRGRNRVKCDEVMLSTASRMRVIFP